MADPTGGLPVVGMVGAGQLARMTQQAAIALGVRLRVLAADPTDAAALVTADATTGDYRRTADLVDFAAGCSVVTFDHEQVPQPQLRELASRGVLVRPSPEALLFAQDKLAMRQRLTELGLPVPAWAPADRPAQVAAFAERHGWPVVVKAARGGYDGRGVWTVGDPAGLAGLPDGRPLLVETRVPLRRELAAVVARRPSGELRGWPVVQTVQRDGICVQVVAPAPDLDPPRAAAAGQLAADVAERLQVTGVLAVELFETPDGLVVNELAMRPHNSAHWTIEGAVTSQFSQHLRAVLDWPLGDTGPTARWAVMVNLLGGPATRLASALPSALGADRRAHVHLYGKRSRPGRKIGHVTVLGDDLAEARRRAERVAGQLAGPR